MATLSKLLAPDPSATHLDALPSFACLFSHQPRGGGPHVSTAGRHGRRPHPIRFTVRCSAGGGTPSDDLIRPFERLTRRDVVLGGLGCLAAFSTNTTTAHASAIGPPDLSRCHSAAVVGDANPNLKALYEWCPPFLESAVEFTPPTPATTDLKLRPAAYLVDQAYVEKFERAIQLMKELPGDDPRSFHQQANVLRAHTQVAPCWLFLPWHRIYLYFYERILGKLVGDEDFAIPFWNWDHPGGMSMPAMYTNPARSPLFLSHLAATHLFPDDVNLYFTKMLDGSQSRKPFGEETMGNFFSASRDAMVYARHANVDRTWDFGGKMTGHSIYGDPEWLNPAFYFYDENKQLVRVKVSDALEPERLGYTYETRDPLWVNNAAPTRKNFQTAEEMKVKAARRAAVFPVVLSSAVSTIVKRPKTSRSRKEKAEEEEVLVVRDIEVESGVSAKFDVFVNAPDYEGLTASAAELAGSFTSLPRFTPLKTNLRLGLSGLLELIGADGNDEIVVTLVPRAAQGKVKIGGVGIEYIRNR